MTQFCFCFRRFTRQREIRHSFKCRRLNNWNRLGTSLYKTTKMSSAGTQFTLLLWKNFVLQGRKKCVTVFEILVPLFFAALLLMIRAISESSYINTDTVYDSFNFINNSDIPATKSRLLYTPSNTYTDALMSTVQIATSATNCKYDFSCFWLSGLNCTVDVSEFKCESNRSVWSVRNSWAQLFKALLA